mgnify:FL=1|tara:strand:+ start:5547 stop:5993 length:447 start_codon:yes stop_codon:yes gene_type:complete
MQQKGINRIVVAVWDFEKGKTYFETLLDAEFAPENTDGEAEAFGVRVAMAWDAGIELISPIPNKPSPIRAEMEQNGEGIKGVVFAVLDADNAMKNGETLGLHSYYQLDYTQEEINNKCQGRFTTYKEHFISAKAPLNATILLGEFLEA